MTGRCVKAFREQVVEMGQWGYLGGSLGLAVFALSASDSTALQNVANRD